MNISGQLSEPLICNTTPVRIFALVGQVDLLSAALGGTIRLPRQVLDDEDVETGPRDLLSEIGKAERYFATRSSDPDATRAWSALRALRTRTDIEIVDLDDKELRTYAELVSPDLPSSYEIVAPLGAGESAVIAVAEHRGWGAAMDDAAARRVLGLRHPGCRIVTSRDLLRQATASGVIESSEAQIVYIDMLEKGYRGPPELWS